MISYVQKPISNSMIPVSKNNSQKHLLCTAHICPFSLVLSTLHLRHFVGCDTELEHLENYGLLLD